MNDKNVSLNDMMDKTPRTGSTAPVDLTQGYIDPQKEAPTPVKVSATQSGPIDMSTAQTFDPMTILPKREKPNEMEDNLFNDLDAAIDRECASITERVNAITVAQEQEYKDQVEAAEIEAQEKADAEAINPNAGSLTNPNDEDYGLGLYDEEEITPTPVTVHLVPTTSDTIYPGVTGTDSWSTAGDTAPTGIPTTADAAHPTGVPSVECPKQENAANETETPSFAATIKTVEKPTILDGVKDEDLFADDEELADEPIDNRDTNAMLEELKKEAKEKITPIKKTLDLSKFTISKKSVNAQKAMKLAAESRISVADWALLSAERPISMSGLSGAEILKLNPENSNRNRLNTFRDMYRVIYDHVYDANKPEFETWLKQTRFVDLQHVYFALYMATFGGSNFVNYSCPHCNKVFLKDIKFEDMIVYSNDETRQKVRDILKMDTNTPNKDEYPVDLFQISNSYVFGLRTPSIWNVIIETASLSDNFLEKHADLIDIVSYIDTIYIIDEANNDLIPIDTKPDKNDQAKTSARRIKVFYDIISGLTSEEYYTLRSHIASYDEDAGKLNYQIPACTCPECATEIPANTDITPDNMLFMRHQLAAIVNL